MKRDPELATLILREGIDSLLACEFDVGKHMVRNYVNATLGFDKLSKKTKIPIKSLMRMLGPSGNPQMSNLFSILGVLRKHARIDHEFSVG